MKVLLRERVDKLGERGEIVDVATGYARNYLLPRQLAVRATEANFAELERERVRIARLAEKERAERKAAIERLEQSSCTVVAAASPEGHLYGSVGPRQIAEALSADGIEVSPGDIDLDEPFDETGVYLVQVRLGPDEVASTRLWIVAE